MTYPRLTIVFPQSFCFLRCWEVLAGDLLLSGAAGSHSADADVPVSVYQRDHDPQRRGAENPPQVGPEKSAAVTHLFPAAVCRSVTVTSSTAAALHTVTAACRTTSALCSRATSAHITLAQLQQLGVHQDDDEERDAYRKQQVQPAVHSGFLRTRARTRE